MKEYLNITRKPIFVTMKTLLFFIPIGIITNRICESYLGELQFSLNSIMSYETVIIIAVFCGLSIGVYLIEHLLTASLIFMDRKVKVDSSFKKSLVTTDKILTYLRGVNPYRKISDFDNRNQLRFEATKELSFLSFILILWLIAFNTLLSYLSILFVVILTFYLYKAFNSFFNHYKKNESNPVT